MFVLAAPGDAGDGSREGGVRAPQRGSTADTTMIETPGQFGYNETRSVYHGFGETVLQSGKQDGTYGAQHQRPPSRNQDLVSEDNPGCCCCTEFIKH